MRAKSWAGGLLAFAYAALFAGAYFLYLQRVGQWFADLPVVSVSLPYLYVARALSGGEYSFSGDMTGAVITAAAFGMALAYFAGWLVESIARGLWRLARGI
jgi:hypothetical protein